MEVDEQQSAVPTNSSLNSPETLGAAIDRYKEMRDQLRAAEKEAKLIREEMEELEIQLLEMLDSQDLTHSRGRKASATVSEQDVPVVEDWEAFEEYVKANDALYLFERRPATKAWRELREIGEEVPGTKPFTRRKINVRAIT